MIVVLSMASEVCERIEVTCISQFAIVDNVIMSFQYKSRTGLKVNAEDCDGWIYTGGWEGGLGGQFYK